uniref:Ubiquinol-cytochrome C reductase n=1 Tax=Pseudodiaptomus poplesia TaxID=213370 RepID=A0A0U2TKK7_9MAXI|nr:ubiquinol-cytochrome C reductase [Pseudodiaptomus poplesia]ALS04952.1 ubiquinol-cytochrome C reductase [Pseudodiaptomus poplesia]
MLGPKHLNMLKAAVPSLITYGGAGGIAVLFFTSEWKGKDLLQYLPVYNRKYFEDRDRDM